MYVHAMVQPEPFINKLDQVIPAYMTNVDTPESEKTNTHLF